MTAHQPELGQQTALARAWARARQSRVFTITAGLGALCLFLTAFVDRPVAFYIKDTVTGPAFAFWNDVTHIGSGNPYFVFFGLLFLGARGMVIYTAPMAVARWYANLARTALFGLICCAAAGLLVNVIKIVIGRPRPRKLYEEGEYGLSPFTAEWAYASFPSGHSQTAFTVATVIALAVPRFAPFCFIMAGMIALSRVMISVHYLSDIVFGSWVGLITVLLIDKYYFRDLQPVTFGPYRRTTTVQQNTTPLAHGADNDSQQTNQQITK